jgi:hypothetical protein
MESSKTLRIRDRDNVVVGNRALVELMVGDFDSDIVADEGDPARNGMQFPSVKRALVAGNTGTLYVGSGFGELPKMKFKVLNTTVEKHSGTIKLLHQEGTTQSAATTQIYPVAVKLTPSDVGPFAPTAPLIGGSV